MKLFTDCLNFDKIVLNQNNEYDMALFYILWHAVAAQSRLAFYSSPFRISKENKC